MFFCIEENEWIQTKTQVHYDRLSSASNRHWLGLIWFDFIRFDFESSILIRVVSSSSSRNPTKFGGETTINDFYFGSPHAFFAQHQFILTKF